MAETVATSACSRHRVLPETAVSSLAKADLRNPEAVPDVEWRQRLGGAAREVRGARSLKELADVFACDDRQIARWERGEETPQWHRYFAAGYGEAVLLAFARAIGSAVEIDTVLRLRRIA